MVFYLLYFKVILKEIYVLIIYTIDKNSDFLINLTWLVTSINFTTNEGKIKEIEEMKVAVG